MQHPTPTSFLTLHRSLLVFLLNDWGAERRTLEIVALIPLLLVPIHVIQFNAISLLLLLDCLLQLLVLLVFLVPHVLEVQKPVCNV